LKRHDGEGGGGENVTTTKRIFEVKVSFSSKNVYFPFTEETLGAVFFLFLSFYAPSLEDLGVVMIFEEKITSSKTSFQMASIYWRWTQILECSYAR
jgi:hypothetical protein